jgi:hypothetical protein
VGASLVEAAHLPALPPEVVEQAVALVFEVYGITTPADRQLTLF